MAQGVGHRPRSGWIWRCPERERGHSIASDALCALTTFAWTIPHLHRLELYIETWNAASIRTAERAGYEREGLLRSHQEIAGQRCDMFLYAAIRESTVR